MLSMPKRPLPTNKSQFNNPSDYQIQQESFPSSIDCIVDSNRKAQASHPNAAAALLDAAATCDTNRLQQTLSHLRNNKLALHEIVDVQNENQNCLHLTCCAGHIKCIRILLNYAAQTQTAQEKSLLINAQDANGHTAIMYAIKSKHAHQDDKNDILQLLIQFASQHHITINLSKQSYFHHNTTSPEHNLDIDSIKSSDEWCPGETATILACRLSQLNALNQLIQYAASSQHNMNSLLDITSSEGLTALMHASQSSDDVEIGHQHVHMQ
jgi:ankyrin repeat protein